MIVSGLFFVGPSSGVLEGGRSRMVGQSQGTSKGSLLCLCCGRGVTLIFLLFTFLVVSCASAQAPPNVAQNSWSLPSRDDVVPGEVVVGFLPGVSDENVKAV